MLGRIVLDIKQHTWINDGEGCVSDVLEEFSAACNTSALELASDIPVLSRKAKSSTCAR
jgi:hypothetical protein